MNILQTRLKAALQWARENSPIVQAVSQRSLKPIGAAAYNMTRGNGFQLNATGDIARRQGNDLLSKGAGVAAVRGVSRKPESAKRIHRIKIDGKAIKDKMNRQEMADWIAYAKATGKKLEINTLRK